jgi:CRISPR-associated protein Cmr5
MTEQSAENNDQRTLEQKRAAEAWYCMERVWNDPQNTKKHKEYANLAKGACAYIQLSGLGQTLAFWLANSNDPQFHQLYKDVSSWVARYLEIPEEPELLLWLIDSASTNDYRRATSEAMSFLLWLKRFAEAKLAEV